MNQNRRIKFNIDKICQNPSAKAEGFSLLQKFSICASIYSPDRSVIGAQSTGPLMICGT